MFLPIIGIPKEIETQVTQAWKWFSKKNPKMATSEFKDNTGKT